MAEPAAAETGNVHPCIRDGYHLVAVVSCVCETHAKSNCAFWMQKRPCAHFLKAVTKQVHGAPYTLDGNGAAIAYDTYGVMAISCITLHQSPKIYGTVHSERRDVKTIGNFLKTG